MLRSDGSIIFRLDDYLSARVEFKPPIPCDLPHTPDTPARPIAPHAHPSQATTNRPLGCVIFIFLRFSGGPPFFEGRQRQREKHTTINEAQ